MGIWTDWTVLKFIWSKLRSISGKEQVKLGQLSKLKIFRKMCYFSTFVWRFQNYLLFWRLVINDSYKRPKTALHKNNITGFIYFFLGHTAQNKDIISLEILHVRLFSYSFKTCVLDTFKILYFVGIYVWKNWLFEICESKSRHTKNKS